MTDYAQLVRDFRRYARHAEQIGANDANRRYETAATALETLLRERDEARAENERLKERQKQDGKRLTAAGMREIELEHVIRLGEEEEDRLRAALRYAEPLVEKWCHAQGNNIEFHAETIAPIRQALGETDD